jgi:hypothetical protein
MWEKPLNEVGKLPAVTYQLARAAVNGAGSFVVIAGLDPAIHDEVQQEKS